MPIIPLRSKCSAFLLPDGRSRPWSWKAARAEGEASSEVMWELRRLAETFAPDDPLAGSIELRRRGVPRAKQLWSQFEGEAGPAFSANHWSLAEHNTAADSDTRGEFQVKTRPKLLLLVAGAQPGVRRGESRVVAEAALHAFCEQMLPSDVRDALAVELNFTTGEGLVCDGSSGARAGTCRHELCVRHELGAAFEQEESPQRCVTKLLQSCARLSVGCVVAGHWLRGLLTSVAELIDNRPVGMVVCDPLTTPLTMTGPSKKRRIDEDTREAVSKTMRAEGRARTVGDWSRFTCTAGSTTQRWVKNEQAESLASMWGAPVSLAADASRLGEPAKEYLLSALWHPGKEVGGVGHLQAQCVLGVWRASACRPAVCYSETIF